MNYKNEVGQKEIGIREWYDFIGQLSGILPGLHLGGQEATLKLLDICRLSAESHVLDIGCGSGNTACFIAKEYGSRVCGIDISEVMVAKAEERAQREGVIDKLEFRVEDVYQMTFEDASFDVAVIESVLTPLAGDKLQALREITRVVRSGGRIGTNESTLDPLAPEDYLDLLKEHPAIYGYFTSQKLQDLYEESGLQVIEVVEERNVKPPGVLEQMGLGGLLSFMIRVYPKVLLKLLRDARFRRASRIDDEITKRGREYMGYTLIVGQKP